MERLVCKRCLRPGAECYCGLVLPFAPREQLVILQHPDERRRGIATGRMCSLCVTNALLIEGFNFTDDQRINRLLEDPAYHAMVLYPHERAVFIDRLDEEGKRELCPSGKVPLIFIIDGTWHNARKMIKHSRNLHDLPFICFTPNHASQFQVRRQPHAHCLSTIEAIHRVLEIFDNNRALTGPRPYDNLLRVFSFMVSRQLVFVANGVGANHQTGDP